MSARATAIGEHDARDRAESGLGLATIGVLFLISLVFLTLTMARSVNTYDEGLILLGADRVLHGAVPYRDFYDLYAVGQFYVLAALFKLFGASVLVERVWDTIVRCCCVVLVPVLVAQVAPRRVALACGVANLVWVASYRFYGYPVFPCLALALAGLVFLAPVFGNGGAARRLVAAGLCAGVIALFRYDIGISVFGAEFALLAVTIWFQQRDTAGWWRVVLRCLLLFAAGFAVIVVPAAIAFAANGMIPDLIFQAVLYPARYYVRMRSTPFPHLWVLRVDPVRFAVYLPLVFCAATSPSLFAAIRDRSAGESPGQPAGMRPRLQWLLLTLLILTLIFFVKGSVRVGIVQMAMALTTSLVLAGALAQPIPGRGLIGRFMAAAAVAALFVFTVLRLPTDFETVWPNLAWAAEPAAWQLPASGVPTPAGSCRMPPGFEQMACFSMPEETIETASYVQQHTGPNDPVFVGLTHHDRLFGNDILLYFIMHRPPATKWYEFDPGMTTLAPIQQQIVDDLKRAKPKLIVLEPNWVDFAQEPNDSMISSGVTILDDYIKQTFEPVATFGQYTILRDRSSP
jgi:hypothetical protein